jgi:tRNA(fMet)-specific endonuclease VapC
VILLDTNILIEVLKGNKSIIEKLIPGTQYCISVVCSMELIYGARDKAEVKKIEKALGQLRCYHITSSISKIALELMRKYSKSHGLAIPDALIASTAIIEELPLFTLNVKDFRYIDTLSLSD